MHDAQEEGIRAPGRKRARKEEKCSFETETANDEVKEMSESSLQSLDLKTLTEMMRHGYRLGDDKQSNFSF